MQQVQIGLTNWSVSFWIDFGNEEVKPIHPKVRIQSFARFKKLQLHKFIEIYEVDFMNLAQFVKVMTRKQFSKATRLSIFPPFSN